MEHLTTYQTHKLIKAELPTASTVYERENKGQMTIDEWLDLINERTHKGDLYEI